MCVPCTRARPCPPGPNRYVHARLSQSGAPFVLHTLHPLATDEEHVHAGRRARRSSCMCRSTKASASTPSASRTGPPQIASCTSTTSSSSPTAPPPSSTSPAPSTTCSPCAPLHACPPCMKTLLCALTAHRLVAVRGCAPAGVCRPGCVFPYGVCVLAVCGGMRCRGRFRLAAGTPPTNLWHVHVHANGRHWCVDAQWSPP